MQKVLRSKQTGLQILLQVKNATGAASTTCITCKGILRMSAGPFSPDQVHRILAHHQNHKSNAADYDAHQTEALPEPQVLMEDEVEGCWHQKRAAHRAQAANQTHYIAQG